MTAGTPDNVAQLLQAIYAPRVIVGPELGELQRVITGQGLPTSQRHDGAFLNEGAARAQGIWMMAVEWACKEAARRLAAAPAVEAPQHDNLRDNIGQAIADYAAEHMNPGGDVGIDWLSARDIDPLADTIVQIAALQAAEDAARWRAWCEFTAAQDEPARLAMEAVIGAVLDAGRDPTKEDLDRAIDAARHLPAPPPEPKPEPGPCTIPGCKALATNRTLECCDVHEQEFRDWQRSKKGGIA